MKTLLLYFLILTTLQVSHAQDRGCQGSYFHYLITTPDTIIDRSSLIGDFYSTGPFPSYSDTIKLEIEDNQQLVFSWAALDRFAHQYSSEIFWFKDNLEIDSSEFEYSFDSDYGDCYNPTNTSTSINISTEGLYYMFAPGLDARSSYIQVTRSTPIVTDTIITQPQSEIILFPNPAKEVFNLKHGKIDNGTLVIYDSNGKTIKTIDLNSELNITRVWIGDIATGTYFVVVHTDVHGIIQKKIIIN